jgi:hypothetical protein
MSKTKDQIRSFVMKIEIIEDFNASPIKKKKRSGSAWVEMQRKTAKEIKEKPVPARTNSALQRMLGPLFKGEAKEETPEKKQEESKGQERAKSKTKSEKSAKSVKFDPVDEQHGSPD